MELHSEFERYFEVEPSSKLSSSEAEKLSTSRQPKTDSNFVISDLTMPGGGKKDAGAKAKPDDTKKDAKKDAKAGDKKGKGKK